MNHNYRDCYRVKVYRLKTGIGLATCERALVCNACPKFKTIKKGSDKGAINGQA